MDSFTHEVGEVTSQAEIREKFEEAAPKLGTLVFRRTLYETRMSHWQERGAVVAVETPLDTITMDQLKESHILLPERVVEAVSDATQIPVEEILGSSRKRNEATARQLCMYILKVHGQLGSPEIGRYLSRDHSTVLSGISKIESALGVETVHGEITMMLREAETALAINLNAKNRTAKDKDPVGVLDTIAVTREGLHSYPTTRINLAYAQVLGVKMNTLVLDRTDRIASEELLETYGAYALDLLDIVAKGPKTNF